MPGDDFEKGIDAILVASVEEVERLLRRGSSIVLLPCFDLEAVQRVQVAFNLLESGEGSLAVAGNGTIVLRESNVGGCASSAAVIRAFRNLKALSYENKLDRVSTIEVSHSLIERYAAINLNIRRKGKNLDGLPPRPTPCTFRVRKRTLL